MGAFIKAIAVGPSQNCWRGRGGGQAEMGVQSEAVTGFVVGENAARCGSTEYSKNSHLSGIEYTQAYSVTKRVFVPMFRLKAPK